MGEFYTRAHTQARTAASCAVRENSGVDAVEHAFDEWPGASIVHLVLRALVVEHDVEGEAKVGVPVAAPDVQAFGRLCGRVERY